MGGMTVNQLKDAWGREPFIPFQIHYPSGKPAKVNHPEFMSLSPTGRVATVWLPNDHLIYIDVSLVTAIETLKPVPA